MRIHCTALAAPCERRANRTTYPATLPSCRMALQNIYCAKVIGSLKVRLTHFS
ncbi:predicted protein [Botrytis cinerea T4]|uniref:Uncharacterized protein n=1 Tax=Botryotinia fuckeliana (strain T4) TaxID=999810 RepID=G2XS42_BOTF4|nr:predicted protein [Botrytis cinerea T4]